MCNILVLWRSLNGSHKRTSQCKKGVERKRLCLAEEEERAATSRAFSAYGRTLDILMFFKYLVIVSSAVGDDWPTVIQNLTKTWVVWRRMMSILIR